MSAKDQGTQAFKEKNYQKAVELYTQAIQENPSDHTIYGNRSASYHNMKQYKEALADSDKCIEIKADWSKGYQRKGNALTGLGQLDEALEAFEEGLKVDPNNAQIKQGVQNIHQQMTAQMGGGMGGMPGMGMPGGGMGGPPGGGMGNMFGGPEAEAKLKADPKIQQFMQDPQFAAMWQMCQQNPQMLMQLVQSDPRFMHVFKVLTGVDLMDMQEQQMKEQDKDADAKKKREAEEALRKQEEEKRKREEAEAALPDEERLELQNKKEAEALKAQGNEFYKKKEFTQALEYYSQAIARTPKELTYYSNKAACFFEMKKFDECVKACDEAIEMSKGGSYDYVKLAKAMSRKGNALVKMGQVDEGIQMFEKALLENQDHGIKMSLIAAQKIKKEKEARDYINPEIAEEHRTKGNELFKAGNFPGALKEFDEGLKRNPQSVAIYSNRSLTWVKLMDFNMGLKDADKCLEIDPNFVKAYIRKGNCHHMMKEYHKAMKAWDDGLKLEPNNAELMAGKNKTIMTIQSTSGASGGNDEERLRHAMADPEIQKIMRDPTIIQVLKELQEQPQKAMASLKDPYISDCINKLVAAGVVKMG